ncbi:MAG: YHYH protein [bacterium]
MRRSWSRNSAGLGLLRAALLGIVAACGGAPPTAATPPGSPTVPAVVPELTALPLGDGNISTSPRVGYVYSCQTTFGNNGAPLGSAPWIAGSTWNQTSKPTVQGEVLWPNSHVSITVVGAERIVSANNLPSHATGVFPIDRSDPVHQYDGNPNPIAEQTILLRLAASPQAAAAPTCVPQGLIGFTTSGAALYNALDGAGRDAAAHEVQDRCAGHPQGMGQYHYHSWSTCLHDVAESQSQHSDLIGYALDGYGVFGQLGEGGRRLANADLDACHGHTHAIPWDGQSQTMYHYHMTREYPYSVGCFHGVRT